jgi:non-ribosomal peptide synthetase component F
MSLEMLPAVVGVLRLGACYAPMDVVSWSRDRVDAALEATGAKTVLATTAIHLPGYNVISIRRDILDSPEASRSLEEYPYLISARQELKPTDLVYIIFTSGTTGKPKGVMIPQSCVVNLIIQDYDGILVIKPGKKVLLLFSIAFDGQSVMAILFPPMSDICDRLRRNYFQFNVQWRHNYNGYFR